MLSLIQTYKYELTLMVGKSCLATLGSANSFGIRVSALTSKGRSVCSLGSTGGGYCVWLFHIKQKHFVQQHSFLCVLTYSILLSTRQTAVAVCRRSDGSDGQPGNLWASFPTKRAQNICMLSCVPTKWNQLWATIENMGLQPIFLNLAHSILKPVFCLKA